MLVEAKFYSVEFMTAMKIRKRILRFSTSSWKYFWNYKYYLVPLNTYLVLLL